MGQISRGFQCKLICFIVIYRTITSLLQSYDEGKELLWCWSLSLFWKSWPDRLTCQTLSNDLTSKEAYSQPCQTSKIERFVKIINSFTPLTVFTKRSILDVWYFSEYASEADLRLVIVFVEIIIMKIRAIRRQRL